MFWHCPCGSLWEYWWGSALCCIIAAGHIKAHRAKWRPVLPLASLSLNLSFSVLLLALSNCIDPNQTLCSELQLEQWTAIVSAFQLHTLENIWLWATLLSRCVCVCSGRSGGAILPQCPLANYTQSEAIEKAGATAGKAWLQLSALTLLLTTVYLCLSSLSSSISGQLYPLWHEALRINSALLLPHIPLSVERISRIKTWTSLLGSQSPLRYLKAFLSLIMNRR